MVDGIQFKPMKIKILFKKKNPQKKFSEIDITNKTDNVLQAIAQLIAASHCFCAQSSYHSLNTRHSRAPHPNGKLGIWWHEKPAD